MRVIVNKDYHSFSTSFYLEYDRNGRRVIIGQKNGLLVEQELEEAVIVNSVLPLFVMPERMANDFIKLLADYASDQGIRTDNENLLKGKLQATEKHLEDMRLAFNKLLSQ